MKEYQKMMRRLISHPSYAMQIIRRLTKRRKTCCLKCGILRQPQKHHTDTRGIITYYCVECKQTYSELYGTALYRSKIPPAKWCIAILEWTISTGSISAAELSRKIGVHHDSAWNMLMKIRKQLSKNIDDELLEEFVEADEAWFGKKNNQDIILGLVQRTKRKLRLEVVPNVREETLYPLVKRYVKQGSTFYTDSRISYAATGIYYHHKTVNHSKGEFGNRKGTHTNTIEQIWGDIKGIIRTIHHGISNKV